MARNDRELEAFEAELVEAWRDLARLPDRERSFLAAGSRSCWPSVVRDRITDYPGDDTPRRPGLSRAEMARLEALFLGEGCVVRVVPEDRVKLVATALALKAWPERRGFRWEAVWQRLGGKRCGATTDGLRARYEAQLRRMASVGEIRLGHGAPSARPIGAPVADAGPVLTADPLDILEQALQRLLGARLSFAAGLIGQGELASALADLDAAQAAIAA